LQKLFLKCEACFYLEKNWSDEKEQGSYLITDLQEIKTTWHPIENSGI